MSEIISTKCPNCGRETDIELEVKTTIAVFTCVSCKSSLMYFYGRTFEIDAEGMEKLTKSRASMKSIEGLITAFNKKAEKSLQGSKSSEIILRQDNIHKIGEAVRNADISEDDIADLIITLETSNGIDDFLENLD